MPKRSGTAAAGTDKKSKGDDKGWQKVAAWFLGPKGENGETLRRLINDALTSHLEFREDYLPPDPIYITKQIKQDAYYKEQIEKLFEKSAEMNKRLFNSVAFSSMRYQGHMLWDITMPGIVGYFSAALYNQNNTAAEASPVTTQYERSVGDELCKMVGFPFPPEDTPADESAMQADDDLDPAPRPWGHITADGSIANIESMWAARNLKYHPLAIQKVLQTNPALSAAKDLAVPFWDKSEPDGKKMKTLVDMTQWEVLNIDVDDALNLAPRISAQYKIPSSVITAALEPFDIQQQGITALSTIYNAAEKVPVCFCPSDKHYSWPKAAAILGIGMANLHSIPVDNDGRMRMDVLRERLIKCAKEKIPVLQVVTVTGSTEESAVDDIKQLLALRKEMQENYHLSFPIHADGAWGAFYCCMMRKDEKSPPAPTPQLLAACETTGMVPRLPLSRFVESALEHLKYVDTVTADPHKSGYIQYPAGSLLYRNGTMRNLLTLEAPVVFKGALDPGVGVYGIEGSKPGAAAAAVYLSQQVIGFDKPGYGQILSEGVFNVKITWCILNTLARDDDPFIIVTFNPLGKDKKEEDANRAFIRARILGKTNEEIASDPEAMEFLREHGPDLSINAWSLNFKKGNPMECTKDTPLNDSLDLLNDLVNAVNEATYILNDPEGMEPISKNGFFRKKLIFTNSTFENDRYGDAVQRMKDSLGVGEHLSGDLAFMVNTVGKPFETATNFMETFQTDLRDVIMQSVGRVTDTPDIHGFLGIPSGDHWFFHHFPMRNMQPHEYQVTVRAKFVDPQMAAKYDKHSAEHKDQEPVIANHDVSTLYNWIYDPTVWVDGYAGGMPPPPSTDPPSKVFMTAELEVVDVPLFHHFLPATTAAETKPKFLTYFMYGYQGHAHACHWVTVFDTFDAVVTFTGQPEGVSDEMLQLGFLITFDGIEEKHWMEDPLKKGQTYPVTYTGENGVEKKTTVTVKFNNWFSNYRINC